MDETKVYGTYPGNLSEKVLEKIYTMKEEKIWKLIYYIESEIFWMNHEDRNYEIDQIELIEKEYALDYVIYSTKRFGNDFKEPCKESRIEKSSSYINWYNNWEAKIMKENIKQKIKR